MKYMNLQAEMLKLIDSLREYERFSVSNGLMSEDEFVDYVLMPTEEEYKETIAHFDKELKEAQKNYAEATRYADDTVVDFIKAMMRQDIDERKQSSEGADSFITDVDFAEWMRDRGFNDER